ncbi:plasminogen activator inhibitor 1 RNA-binding protein [Rhizoctonia solani AG-1 IB]|uniref:Hyaluronan/mRNA-binding protein domain-containing protein n=2 Tax=Rhizoctonia solani TaxID=456999 RepID=A0A8H3ACZ2_9AGAM|nr:unnamed protein product [Rhizoctonia solani]CCO26890.1 plasminogen activator inhibitor 1 RNA-binding protein [Rhizoctonia solani AG-1 IB]
MSVASRNPFALLNDDDVISTPAPGAAAPTPNAPAPQKKEQSQKGPSSRGGRYYQRGGGTKTTPRDERVATQEAATGTGDRFAEGRPERGRGRGRGGRGRGEGGRGRGRDSRPDRHSQTGKVDTEKRVSSGWGAEEGRTELDAEQSGAADATVDAGNEWGGAANNDWSAPAEGGAENKPAEGEEQGERPQKEEEEEDNTMTLTEYLAKKKASEAIPGRLQARAANEGADNNLWKDAVQVQRDEDEENYFIGKTKSTPKARTKKEEKVHIDIEARFAPIERGRGRGDRGRGDRGRGDRSRGRGRGGDSGRGRRPEANLDVSDESAFPSLS